MKEHRVGVVLYDEPRDGAVWSREAIQPLEVEWGARESSVGCVERERREDCVRSQVREADATVVGQ